MPPQVICCRHKGRHPISCRVLDHLHMGNDALNPLCLALRPITTQHSTKFVTWHAFASTTLPTMRQGSATMMDGGGEVYCPWIVGGCQKNAKRGVVDL